MVNNVQDTYVKERLLCSTVGAEINGTVIEKRIGTQIKCWFL